MGERQEIQPSQVPDSFQYIPDNSAEKVANAPQEPVNSSPVQPTSPEKQKPQTFWFVIALVFLVGAAAGLAYFFGLRQGKNLTDDIQPGPDQVACTLEAKLCPDGSSVGRSGPNCEFDPCPETPTEKVQTYSGRLNPFELTYPASYKTEIQDVSGTPSTIEQVQFTDSENTIDEFLVRVDPGVSELPEYPYDQEATGKYTLDGIEGIYLELPQGYGDGGQWKPRPTTYLFFINDNREYQFTFYGVSDIKNKELVNILDGFTFSSSGEKNIPEIGLSFNLPESLNFRYDVDNTILTLFIEKDNQKIEDYYQLYGIIQFDSPKPANLDQYTQGLQDGSVESTISGYSAVSGQIKGTRNRFVTYILTDKGVLSLFTAEPTLENKKLTDQIIATFTFK